MRRFDTPHPVLFLYGAVSKSERSGGIAWFCVLSALNESSAISLWMCADYVSRLPPRRGTGAATTTTTARAVPVVSRQVAAD
ncbi:hypothetical protein MTO96_004257 [Rhipicephalus appendiculatus]